MALAAGTRLGPYEILGPIGAGGMGEVYRARDTRLGRDVAVKVLPGDASHTPERLHRFEQEARLAGSLNHPNVLTLFDVGISRGRAVPRHGAPRGTHAARRARCGPAAVAKGNRLRPAGGPRPRRRPRARRRPPRPQAREPLRHEGRPRQDPRLRPRQADPARSRDRRFAVLDRHRRGSRRRHARLHGARAGTRAGGRRAHRHLRLRGRRLRDALGSPRFHWRHAGRHDDGDPDEGPGGAHATGARYPRRPRAHRPPLSREGPRRALPVRQGRRLRTRG